MLFIWKLYLNLFIYKGTYIICIFTNKYVDTVREKGASSQAGRALRQPGCPAGPLRAAQLAGAGAAGGVF